MSYVDSTGIALGESRFATDIDVVRRLLPELDSAAPPLSLIEYLDGIPRSALGWPVHASESLRRELFRFVVTAVGRALHDSDGRDLDDLTLEGVRGEPYFRELATLLARCLAHGPTVRLDSILWLCISRMVARLLGRDEALLRELGAVFPDDVAKATRYLDELLRLKGSSPARHAAVKDRALRALLARHDIALGSSGDGFDSGLHRLLVESRMIWTEQPDGLYSFFDLREAFLARKRGLDLESFLGLQKYLRATVDDAWRKRAAGSTSLPERWMLEQFVGEPLLERASRLDLAGLADTQEDDYPARVAVIGSLHPGLSSYILHHAEQFQPSRAAVKRYDIGKDLQKLLKDGPALAGLTGQYVGVVEDVLRWDVLNTLRGFLHDVRPGEAGGWKEGNRRVRASARVLDLSHPTTVHSRRRRGTVVAWKLVGFDAELRSRSSAEAGELPTGEDFEALCLRKILAARESLSVGGGRSDGFERGLGLDVFPRALDALRYAAVLQKSIAAEQRVRLGVGSEPALNPFARAVRLGLAAGPYTEVPIPSEGPVPQVSAVGLAPDDAVALVDHSDDREFVGRVAVDEYDPLKVFDATVVDGMVINHGLVSNERAFLEILASVRLDGMTHAAPDRSAVIAGRPVEFKNYRFELVFDDPVSREVVLVRRITDPALLHGEEQDLFEYVLMSIEQFVSFHDRATDAARHQPVVRRSSVPPDQAPRPTPSIPAAPPRADLSPPSSIPELAIPEAGAFLFGNDMSASQEVLGERLGLRFEDKPSASDSQAFLTGLLGGETPAQWPLGDGWLSGSSDDLGGLVADGPAGLNQDFTSLVQEPSPPEPSEDPLSFADSAFDDFSLGDPRSPMPDPPAVSHGDLFALDGNLLGDDLFAAPAPAGPPSYTGSAPKPLSLLGRLEPDFLAVLADAAPDVAPQVATRQARDRRPSTPASSPPPAPPAPPKPETVRVVRPDFAALFRDYVVFEIDAAGAAPPVVAIGRRYKDVLFDLHRFEAPPGQPWGRQAALDEFMRAKVRDNFVPRSLSYDEVPSGAGPLQELTLQSLEDAFLRVT